MTTATIRFCLNKYGPRCRLSDVLEILGLGETHFRKQMHAGKYPRPVERGIWATEAVARAAAGAQEADDDEGL